MVNAIANVQLELPVPVQIAQTASSTPSTGFSKVKDGVFAALGLKKEDLRASETGSVDAGLANMLSMLAAAVQNTDSAETQLPQISKCSDPAAGIASILEGFGLLNAEGNLTSEALQLLQAAYAAADGAEVQPEAEQAGMPPVQPDITELLNESSGADRLNVPAQNGVGRTAILSQLVPLVNEYLKSLENAHSQSGTPTAPYEGIDTAQAALFESAPALPNAETVSAQTAAEAFQKLVAAVEDALQGKGVQDPAALPEEEEPLKPAQNTADAALPGTSSLTEVFEPLKGTVPAEQTAQTDTAQTVLDLVDSMSVKAQGGATEFEITLKPEHLGKLSIKLTQDADGLKAEIKAADATVKTLLENELSSLQTMLKEKGVEIHRINVAYEAGALAFDNRQGQKQSGSAEESKRRLNVLSVSRASAYGAVTAEAATAAPAVQDDARLALQGSSVEFSA